MLRCPNCQHRNPDHARYCQQCSINLGDYLRAVAHKSDHTLPDSKYMYLKAMKNMQAILKKFFHILLLLILILPLIPSHHISHAQSIEQCGTLGIGRVTDAMWSVDGRQLIVATATRLSIYDASSLNLEPRVILSEHGWIRSMAVSSSGDVAVGYDDGTIIIWDIEARSEKFTLVGHQMSINDLEFSDDGLWLVSASGGQGYQVDSSEPVIYDNSVMVWDTLTGERLYDFDMNEPPFAPAYHVAISPDKTKIAAGGDEYYPHESYISTIIFDLQADDIRYTPQFKEIAYPIFAIDSNLLHPTRDFIGFPISDTSFDKENNLLAVSYQYTGYYDEIVEGIASSAILIWNMATKNVDTVLHEDKYSKRVAFHPNGTQLVTVGIDESVHIWDITTQSQIAVLDGFGGWINDVAFSPDGAQLVSASRSAGVQLWDISTLSPTIKITDQYSQVVAFHPDGTYIAYTTVSELSISRYAEQDEVKVEIWDVSLGETKTIYEYQPQNYFSELQDLAFSPNGHFLAWIDDQIRLWDFQSETLHLEVDYTRESYDLLPIIFKPDSTQLAIGDFRIQFFNTLTGDIEPGLYAPDGALVALIFSPDGLWLASASHGGEIVGSGRVIVWDIKSNEILMETPGYPWTAYNTVHFSPNGHLLIYGGDDGNITIVETETWQTVATLRSYTGKVNMLDISQDGRMIAAGNSAGTIELWCLPQ